MREVLPPVIDSSPLILLARVDALSLLKLLGSRILVPTAVAREVREKASDPATKALVVEPWLEVVKIPEPEPEILAWEMGAGETEVLTWAHSYSGTLAILDDAEARKCAQQLQVTVLGTLGLILKARLEGHLKAARPLVEDLIACGMYLSPQIVDETLALVGE